MATWLGLFHNLWEQGIIYLIPQLVGTRNTLSQRWSETWLCQNKENIRNIFCMIVRNGVQPWRLLTCSAVHKWSPLSNNTFLFLFNPDLAYMLVGNTATGPSLWAGFAFDCSIIMLENQLVNSTSSPLYRFQLNVITCTITHTIVSVWFDVIWSALYLGQFVPIYALFPNSV